MADEKEKTMWEVIFSALAGVAGTVGFNSLIEALRNHVQTAVVKKAKDLVSDTGRPALMRDLMAMRLSADAKDSAAAENIRQWLIRAECETATGIITEGDIVNLLNQLQQGPRTTVLRGLGSLPTYEEFIATMGILRHDNAMQYVIKIAERMRAGENIIDDDLRAIRETVEASLKRVAININTAAGMVRPSIRSLTDALRRIS
jgi:hypothetical protein